MCIRSFKHYQNLHYILFGGGRMSTYEEWLNKAVQSRQWQPPHEPPQRIKELLKRDEVIYEDPKQPVEDKE